ncbi:MAG: ribonuclease P protein component 4 [Thermoplasmata archaeon]
MARRHVSKRGAKDIAEERVDILFEEAAAEARRGNDVRAKRYVGLALRMSERHKVKASHKRTYCPECHVYFVPPRNVRVRTGSGRVSMTCLSCGHVLRYPLRAGKGG